VAADLLSRVLDLKRTPLFNRIALAKVRNSGFLWVKRKVSAEEAERVRQWDSCFNLDHSYIHGGSVRNSPPSRYRQWMTHKLATWIDQFGTSGCVGCGRCITWCPVAIDITEEAAAIRATDLGPAPEGERGISADH